MDPSLLALLYKSTYVSLYLLLYRKPVVMQSPTSLAIVYTNSPHTFTMKGLDVYI